MSNEILMRLGQAFQEKVSKDVNTSRSGRYDLYLADWTRVGPTEAKVLIGYSKHLPVPSRMKVTQWVVSAFNGLLDLKLETLRHHKEQGAISSIVAGTLQHRAPVEFAEHMVPIGADRYADTNGGERTIWTVIEEDGQRFLVREATEDINAILEQRQRHVKSSMGAWNAPSFSTVTAGVTQLDVGDRVKFYMNNIVQQGVIKNVGPNVVKIEVNGAPQAVPPDAVFSVEEKAPNAMKDKQKFLIDFFTKAYGDPAFAKKFVTLQGTK
jgi:hypothetical protein